MPDILIDPRAAAELTRLRVVRAAYLPEVPMVVVVVPVEPLAPKTGVEGGFAISLPDSMTAP